MKIIFNLCALCASVVVLPATRGLLAAWAMMSLVGAVALWASKVNGD